MKHWWLSRPAWLQPACALAALALVAGLFIGGAQPAAVGLFTEPWDKVAHATVFAALAVMLNIALQGAHLLHGKQSISRRIAWVLALLVASVVGVADELHQANLPGRVAGWDDWLADTAGAGVGLAAWAWLQRKQ